MMAKMILKTSFKDHTDGLRLYAPGDDVSHLSEEVKNFLLTGGHIEQVAEKSTELSQKSADKKSKGK